MTVYGVVIPAYNAAATIGETVRSVMDQTIAPHAIVIVDDGSSDGTAELAAKLDGPIRLIRQKNEGPGSATSKGFAALDTPFVATNDADDIWLPEKIERQLAHLVLHPEAAGVFTHLRTFRNNRPDLSDETAVPGWSRTTMFLRREAIDAVGPVVDPPGRRGEMIDWIARAREKGFRFDMLEEVLALRRIHPGSLSYGRDPGRDRGYLEVARLALQRRRNAGLADG